MAYTGLKAANLMSKFIASMEKDNKFDMKVDLVASNTFHSHGEVSTSGAGPLYQLGFNAATMKFREQGKEFLSNM